MRTVTLNASTLLTPDSLMLSLTSNLLLDTVLKSLVDSGSSNSFIDSVFVQTQHLPAYVSGLVAGAISVRWGLDVGFSSCAVPTY